MLAYYMFWVYVFAIIFIAIIALLIGSSESRTRKNMCVAMFGLAGVCSIVLAFNSNNFHISNTDFNEIVTFTEKHPESEISSYIKPLINKGFITKDDVSLIRNQIEIRKSAAYQNEIEKVKTNIKFLIEEKK